MNVLTRQLVVALAWAPIRCWSVYAEPTVIRSHPQLAQDTARILFRVQQFEASDLANAGIAQQLYGAGVQAIPIRYGARPLGGGNAGAPLSGGRCIELNPGEALRIVPATGTLYVAYGVGFFLFDFHHTDRGGSNLSLRLADAAGALLGEWPVPLAAALSGEEQNARAVCFAVVADEPIGWAELRNGSYKTGVDDLLVVCDFSRPYKPLAPPIARAYAIEQLPLEEVVGLNNLGQVIGKAWESEQWQLWQGGATRDLVPSGNDTVSWVYDFNDAGQAVYRSHGVVVNDINDAGLFVGREEIQSSGPNYEILLDGPHAFIASVRTPAKRNRFGKEAFGDPASGVTSVARSINESGQVVGWRTDPQLPLGDDLRNRAFLWHDGQTYELNDWVAPDSGVHLKSGDVINDLGQILASGPSYPTPRYLLTPLPAIAGIRPGAGGATELLWDDWGDRWRYEVEIADGAGGPWCSAAAPGGQPIAGGSWVDPEPAATVGARYYRIRAGHDWDLDGALADNCPGVANPDQADADADGFGDACDPYPTTPGR